MANDDDNGDQGRKKNTDRDHKPEFGRRLGMAPRGSVGRPTAGITEPGYQQSETGPMNEQAHDPNKPFAIETDDPEYNKELAKDHNMLTRGEAEQKLGKDNVARQFYDEDPAKDPDQPNDTRRERAEALAAKFKADKDKERDRGR